MALADAIQGAKRPSQLITWADQDGNVVDLTGATITARIRNTATGVTVAADGAFVLTNASAGVFRWDYGTLDITTGAYYKVTFTATFASGVTPAKTLSEKWVVHEAV